MRGRYARSLRVGWVSSDVEGRVRRCSGDSCVKGTTGDGGPTTTPATHGEYQTE